MPDSDADPDGLETDAPGEQLGGELTVEAYETEEGVVFYDAANPLAWVQTDTTVALDSLD